MTIDQIAHWVRRLEAGGITGFELEQDGALLRLHFGPSTEAQAEPAATPATTTTTTTTIVRALAAGVFQAEHPWSGKAASDMQVRAGQIIGFLRVGTAMNAVTAPCDGRLGAPQVANGSLVGYGHALFDIG